MRSLRILAVCIWGLVLTLGSSPTTVGAVETSGVRSSKTLNCDMMDTYVYKGKKYACIDGWSYPTSYCKQLRKAWNAWEGFRQSGRKDRERAFVVALNAGGDAARRAAATKDAQKKYGALAALDFNSTIASAYNDGLYDAVEVWIDFTPNYC